MVGNLPTICLSVFDHFMNLALKVLSICNKSTNLNMYNSYGGSYEIFALSPTDKFAKPYEIPWHLTEVVITTSQICSTEPEIRFWKDSDAPRGVSEVCDDENF